MNERVEQESQNYIFENVNRKYNQNRPQYRLAFDLLEKIRGKTALDLGCGVGEFSDILKNGGYKVFCVDGIKRFVEGVRERGFAAYLVDLEREKLPFGENTFDLVVSLEVIEHIWNTNHFLEQILRVLKPQGYIIISTPNYDYYKFRMTHLVGKFDQFTYNRRHKKFYNIKSFREEIKDKFEIVDHISRLNGLLSKPLRILKRNIHNKKVMNFFSIQSCILARNNGGGKLDWARE